MIRSALPTSLRPFLAACVLLGLTLLATGCGSTGKKNRDYMPVAPRLYLEARPEENSILVTLPRSGTSISVTSKALYMEADFVNAEVAQVELGRCLMLMMTPRAARDFYRLTTTNQGRRLVLQLNDLALGARMIDRPFGDGLFLVFVEVDDADLDQLVLDMKATLRDVQKDVQRR